MKMGTITRVNRRNEPVTGRDMEEGKADTYHRGATPGSSLEFNESVMFSI